MLQIRDLLVGCSENTGAAFEWHQISPDSCSFLYSRDYVVPATEENSSIVLPALPSLRQVKHWCYPPPSSRAFELAAREKVLLALVHLREKFGVRHALRLVPFEWQRKIKRRLSHRPLHDVINDRATS